MLRQLDVLKREVQEELREGRGRLGDLIKHTVSKVYGRRHGDAVTTSGQRKIVTVRRTVPEEDDLKDQLHSFEAAI